MENQKENCRHHTPRGQTHGSEAVHHPCGCAILNTDMDDHNEDPQIGTICGGLPYCYFCDLMNRETN
jgi:hypothetical protein